MISGPPRQRQREPNKHPTLAARGTWPSRRYLLACCQVIDIWCRLHTGQMRLVEIPPQQHMLAARSHSAARRCAYFCTRDQKLKVERVERRSTLRDVREVVAIFRLAKYWSKADCIIC